jgi:hypothetical protein
MLALLAQPLSASNTHGLCNEVVDRVGVGGVLAVFATERLLEGLVSLAHRLRFSATAFRPPPSVGSRPTVAGDATGWGPPMLHNLSLTQMIHVLGRDRDGLASWRDVLKLARLGAAKGPTKGDGIPFGNHLLNGDLPVRKGRMKAVDKVFELCRVRGQIVADIRGTEQFLNDGQLLLIDRLVIEAADGGFVVF